MGQQHNGSVNNRIKYSRKHFAENVLGMIKDVNCKYSLEIYLGQIFRINIPHINTLEIKDKEAKYSFLIFGAKIHWKYSTEKYMRNCSEGKLQFLYSSAHALLKEITKYSKEMYSIMRIFIMSISWSIWMGPPPVL